MTRFYNAETARWRSLKNGDAQGRIQQKTFQTRSGQYTVKRGSTWVRVDLEKDSPLLIEQEVSNAVLDEKIWIEYGGSA